MMTLEEAIEKEKSIAKSNYELADSYHTYFNNKFVRYENARRERAGYHEQIAKWLEELLDRRTVKLEDYHIERLEALTDTKVVAVDVRGEFDFGCPKCNWTSRVFSKAMIPLCPKCHIEMWPIPGKYY